MTQTNFTNDMVDKAEQNFDNIKEAIKGLYEVLNITLAGKEEDIYYEVGKDNIAALYKNLIELLLNDYGLRKIVKKIKNSDIDLDIVLNEILVEKNLI
ncbi:MAG: hypothetical protein EAX89_12510 [Candidatus Lokiarchaeota archaeon]|nr:hypothetical protein [Candidatus Lokiarchaeota archaeon]